MRAVRTAFALATLIVATFICGATAAQQGTYAWKDARGNTYYTNTPPPTSATEVRTISPPDPYAPRDPRNPVPVPPRPATLQDRSQARIPGQTIQPVPPTVSKPNLPQLSQQNDAQRLAREQKQSTKEQALRSAHQCVEWRQAVVRIERIERGEDPKPHDAQDLKDFAKLKASLKRNIAKQCD